MSLATDDQAVLDEMQVDLAKLVEAWTDRGITPGEMGQVMAASGNLFMLLSGASLSQVIDVLVVQWTKRGGKL